MRARQHPMLLSRGGPLTFPDPRHADAEGLVAIGGDLSIERLLLAYSHGIFPWYDAGLPPLWWSPDPRAVMDAERLSISRSMRRTLRNTSFRLSFDRAFERVMIECGSRREGGTWILPEMIKAYTRLHERGHAHSFEIWDRGELVGGLYGVQIGGLFAAESMFHRRTNASKVVLIASVLKLSELGVELYDVQFLTEHLQSLGAYLVSREEYLKRLDAVGDRVVDLARLELEDPAALLGAS